MDRLTRRNYFGATESSSAIFVTRPFCHSLWVVEDNALVLPAKSFMPHGAPSWADRLRWRLC